MIAIFAALVLYLKQTVKTSIRTDCEKYTKALHSYAPRNDLIKEISANAKDQRMFCLMNYFPEPICFIVCVYAEDDTVILSRLIDSRKGTLVIPAVVYHMHGLAYSNDWFISKDELGRINFDFGEPGKTWVYLDPGEWISDMHFNRYQNNEIAHLITQLRNLMVQVA